ncbi:unnamed protein product, partial [Prorocentrum cordatum]
MPLVISVHGLLGAVDDLDLSSSFLALSSVMSWFLISTLRPDSAMAVGGEGEEGSWSWALASRSRRGAGFCPRAGGG